MNHIYFKEANSQNVTTHNRIPSMLRKEMGEKYCQEFCFGFALDHTKHAADGNAWRETTCPRLCMMSFARTHNVKQMLNHNWFQFEDNNNLVYKKPDFATWPLPSKFTSADYKMYWYGNEHLWSQDTSYWVANFGDLLEFCKHRYERENLVTALNDSDIKAKCTALSVAVADTEDNNKVKCRYMNADSQQVEKVCASWSAPHCVADPDVAGQSICSKEAGTQDGDVCNNCEDDLSIPNIWLKTGGDVDLEKCFAAVPVDLSAPSQDFVNTCRDRYFMSNLNWPNEFWLKKTDRDNQEYVFSKVFFDMVGPLVDPWTNPSRNWSLNVAPETGDNYIELSTCPTHNTCWLDNEAGTLTDGEMNKHRTFVSAEDFAAAKPYGAEGNFVCKYVKTGAFTTAAEDADKTTVADYYQKLTVECRPYEDLTVTPYVAGDDTDYYQMLPLPAYNAADNTNYVPAALTQ